MTGTLDDSSIRDTKAAERRIPFDHIDGAPQYLVTLEGGDHMVFSGKRRRAVSRLSGTDGDAAKDARFHDLIRQATTAFWDAYLRGDAVARQWLDEGGFKAVLDGDGTFEQKPPADASDTPARKAG